jgi:glycosyltransferase involved in cell wall biosynthesis|tara:strand:+ start:3062 stop:4342 length:1281 start_codon:yes stop_codon:yes gene_type:complete
LQGRKAIRILFVTPTMPNDARSGASQRAALHLRALAQLGPVDLVCLIADPGEEIPPPLRHLVASVTIEPRRAELDRWRSFVADTSRLRKLKTALFDLGPAELHSLDPAESAAAAARIGGGGHDLAFGFKLAGAAWIEQVERSADAPFGRKVADFDDFASEFRDNARRRRQEGPLTRLVDQVHTRRVRHLETRLLRQWSAVILCSANDADAVHRLAPSAKRPDIVPNAVPLRDPLPLAGAADMPGKPVRLLFIGLLSYEPNRDAVRWFISDILPALRNLTPPLDFIVDIAGRHDNGALAALCQPHAEVNFLGEVDRIEDAYAPADIVIVPLRQGSGTRLKILEAFTLGRPVVSTAKGVEGIDAQDGRDLLIADTPQAFAKAIATLAADPAGRTQMAEQAWAVVKEKYALNAVAEREAAILGRPHDRN